MLAKYGFWGCLRLIVSYLYTRICFPQARLIRLPFDIRNKRFIKIAQDFTTGFGCRLEAFPTSSSNLICLNIGKNVQMNDYVHIAAGQMVEIGDNVLIASKVFISDINHGEYNGEGDNPLTPPNERCLSTKPVIIKENVWIGESACILPGVTIGSGSIIGALTVVTKSIPPNSIAVGVPAKVVKEFDFKNSVWISK